jgi:hypothetical protein
MTHGNVSRASIEDRFGSEHARSCRQIWPDEVWTSAAERAHQLEHGALKPAR